MSYQVIQGSAHSIPGLADKSVHCIVTSPPYYGLRAYQGDQGVEWPTVEYSPMPGLPPIRIQGCEPECVHEWVDGKTITRQPQRDHDSNGNFGASRGTEASRQGMAYKATQGAYCIHCGGWRGGLGLEGRIEDYIGHLILVLREMWRVLRDDGTLWWNLGDSYAGSGGAHTFDHASPGLSKSASRDGVHKYKPDGGRAPDKKGDGVRPKSLIGVPWRLAFAAQADGWILRNDIIWNKPNPMPESVTDRCTKAHEYIFMLAKQENYYFDAEAIKEPAQEWTGRAATFARNGAVSQHVLPGQTAAVHRPDRTDKVEAINGRNKRSVWTVATQPFSGAHFACWPEKLVDPMIRAGSSQYGACAKCGAPWDRITETERTNYKATNYQLDANAPMSGGVGKNFPDTKTITTGWQPTCSCGCDDVTPCTVLDPFLGSGTTARVALSLGRKPVGVDISNQYLENLVPERTSNVQMQLAL